MPRINFHILKNFFPLFIVFCLFPAPALAEISLSAPKKAARGDAILAVASSEKPVEEFVFYWRGKKHRIKAAQQEKRWTGKILLPAPLDEKSEALSLGAGESEKAGGSALERISAKIALYDKERPTQKLAVNKKYVNPPLAERERIAADRKKVAQALSQEAPESFWSLPFFRPVPGRVNSLFGLKRVFNGEPRSVHKGLDLAAAAGDPVRACADGIVALADNLYFSGNTVYINHGDGVFSAYLHLSETKAKPGQRVERGQVVGLAGATGRVTGPHLHLSMLVQGSPVDPLPLLEARTEKQ